jgi:hypothetical protein
VEALEGDEFKRKVIENEKESDKFYPGLKALDFDLYKFSLS